MPIKSINPCQFHDLEEENYIESCYPREFKEKDLEREEEEEVDRKFEVGPSHYLSHNSTSPICIILSP